MAPLNNFAHAVVSLLSIFARAVLGVMDWTDESFRLLLHSGGLNVDMQTVMLFVVICTVLYGVLRLLRGRLRLAASLLLFLFLAHSLERVAHGPLLSLRLQADRTATA